MKEKVIHKIHMRTARDLMNRSSGQIDRICYNSQDPIIPAQHMWKDHHEAEVTFQTQLTTILLPSYIENTGMSRKYE